MDAEWALVAPELEPKGSGNPARFKFMQFSWLFREFR